MKDYFELTFISVQEVNAIQYCGIRRKLEEEEEEDDRGGGDSKEKKGNTINPLVVKEQALLVDRSSNFSNVMQKAKYVCKIPLNTES
jgi:hypothetical protein